MELNICSCCACTRHSSSRSFLFLLPIISLFFLLTPSLSFAQPYVASGDVFPDVWDSVDAAWENGNPSGYSETETAAMVLEVTTNTTSALSVDLCLQVLDG
ncbi:MAG: hypothetical protein KDD70_12205 [Bdellovibrionales bacterium]|nr:hypothetical protein [Bdellovibrionales bacterium]